MMLTDRFNTGAYKNVDFPTFKGSVKVKLHNCRNHKDEYIYESHNTPTNALANIFAANYGGLTNYQNFADIFTTWLGGVLVFKESLDPTAVNDYGIPAYTSNPVVAHAGQTAITEALTNDDSTRGNPVAGTVTTEGSTKIVFEWGTTQGNAQKISSLGLCHTDIGSYGCGGRADGAQTEALKLLNPFATVACLDRQYAHADDAGAVLAINNNYAYNIYLVSNTSVNVYKTPINCTNYKLQGGSLLPLTAYTSSITVTLSASYALQGKGDCYYYFDFANNKLILFGVPTEGGTTLYKDEIDLSTWQDQTATHTSITVTGAKLWKDRCDNGLGSNAYLSVPKKAMVYNNHLYLYGYGSSSKQPTVIYTINLANTSDIDTVDVTNYSQFYGGANNNTMMSNERFAMLGGIIAHDSFLINGNKTFQCVKNSVQYQCNYTYVNTDSVSSPTFYNRTSTNNTGNMISINKLYLGTKFNLSQSVEKTAAQSMTVEYTLTET